MNTTTTYTSSTSGKKSFPVEEGKPREEVVELTPISISQKEGWFRFKDKVVALRKGREAWTLYIINKMSIEGSYTFTNQCSGAIVDNIDICPQLNQLISNWSLFVEQQEILRRAQATILLNYEAVPNPPSDWEVLVSTMTKIVLSKLVIKNFYINQGSREVSLGLYCYENGYYRECEDRLKHELEEFAKQSALLEEKVIGALVNEVKGKISRSTYSEYRPARRCLLFKSKVFCWDQFLQTKDLEKSLIEPSPDLVVMHRIPWEIKPELYKNSRAGLLKYVPPKDVGDIVELFKGLAPKSFKTFLDWVKYPGEEERDAYPKVVLLLEVIGYTLYPHGYPLNKAILLVGEGSNGKTTYLNLIERILSKENVASVNLSDLDPRINRFASADLWNKLANLSSEPIKHRTFNASDFKRLTGEDVFRFERKHRDAFLDHNYAKMVFSANELPQVTEDTYAFWSRWIVIEFPNRFPKDPKFFDETFTQEEVEGVIICALHAFRLVLERSGFTEHGVKDAKEEWLIRSSPVYRVVRRMLESGLIELDPKGVVVKKDLYELYKKYIEVVNEEEGEELVPLEQKDFTRHLTRMFPIRIGKSRISGRMKHTYIGVRIKDYSRALSLTGYLETPRTTLEEDNT